MQSKLPEIVKSTLPFTYQLPLHYSWSSKIPNTCALPPGKQPALCTVKLLFQRQTWRTKVANELNAKPNNP